MTDKAICDHLTSHSPLPWTLNEERSQIGDEDPDYRIDAANGDMILCDTSYYPSAPLKNDAAFIVHAVNCYDDLLSALQRFCREADPAILVEKDLPGSYLADALRDALAAVEKAKV